MDDSNRDLIGATIVSTAPLRRYVAGEEPPPGPTNAELWDALVEEGALEGPVSATIYAPNSIAEFTANGGVTPELLMTNGACAIFSPAPGEGWLCEAGTVLSFDFAVYPPDTGLAIGYIQDGLMHAYEVFSSDLAETYRLEVEESGSYQLYVLSFCSDYLALKEGLITLT